MKKVFILSVITIGLTLLGAVSMAAQTAPSASVAGDWEASMNTPGGPVPVTFVFKVNGEKLTGTAKRSRGDVALEGTIKGSDINFSYTVDYNGNGIILSFSGKVKGDAMSGTVSFGGQADDSWSAKRVPAKPKT
jgi:hypothetical protein